MLARRPSGTDAATPPHAGRDRRRRARAAPSPRTRRTWSSSATWWRGPSPWATRLLRAALTRLSGWRPDVVHAHDWLVAHPAIALADALGVPLVATFHATEAGRYGGWLSGADQQAGALDRVVAGQPGRRADHLLGGDAGRGGRAVRARPCRDHGGAQRDRAARVACRTGAGGGGPPAARTPRADALLLRTAGVREGRPGPRRGAPPDPQGTSGHAAAGRGHGHGGGPARRRGTHLPRACAA